MAHTISALGTALEFGPANGQTPGAAQIDSTHWLLTYNGASDDGFAVVAAIDGSGNLTLPTTAFEFDTVGGNETWPVPVMMDADQAVVVYRSVDNDGFAQLLNINTGTWAVTSAAAALEFEIADFLSPSAVKANASTVVVVWRGTANDGFAIALSVNLGTGAVTAPTAALEYDTSNGVAPCLLQINSDPERYLVTHQGFNDDGFARVLTLNTGTLAITATSVLEFDVTSGAQNETVQLDANHFLNVWRNVDSSINRAQVLEVNLTTWAITALGSPVTIESSAADVTSDRSDSLGVLYEDSGVYTVARAFREPTADGGAARLQVLAVDSGASWAVTEEASVIATPDLVDNPKLQVVSDSRVIVAWSDEASFDGFIQAFDISASTGPVEEHTDVIGITDSAAPALSAPADATDPIGILDDILVEADVVLGLSADPIGITDVTDVLLDKILDAVSDLVGITDAVVLLVGALESQTDNVGITDSVQVVKAIVLAPTDAIGITDSQTIVEVDRVTHTDNLGVTDTVQVVQGNVVTRTDTVGITDSVQIVHPITLAFVDVLGIIDTVIPDTGFGGVNICLTVGPPVFLSRAGAVDLVNRSATHLFHSRVAGTPVFEDRDATLVFQDHEADVVLDCEEV